MRFVVLLLLLAGIASAEPPAIRDLRPRGAQKGRPFTLTVIGSELGEGARIWSTMPATFTPMVPADPEQRMAGRYASFLVEPKQELAVGVYPLRVETPEGISNIQYFTVGAFPELQEEESEPGSQPNQNDGIETAESLPPTDVTVNGTLRGPERDFFRLSAKAGEKRVFEIEARRCFSAIDPVLRVRDQSGKLLARSEDAPLLGLDSRVEVTFPQDGYYYVEIHDARFSKQTTNFYRLKSGSYAFAREIFPLGGRRGEVVKLSLGSETVTADLREIAGNTNLTHVGLPDDAALPVPFAVGDAPEVVEPIEGGPLAAPVTVNGLLSEPAEVDSYTFRVEPGEELTFQMEARELGTSKLMAVLTARDEKGGEIGRAGDEPLAEDFFNVNQSRTAGDPFLQVKVPRQVRMLTVTVEDLARRGGPGYAYRLLASRLGPDVVVSLNVPYVNIPAGGSAAVPVSVERRGYEGDLRLRIPNAPEGLTVEGGYVIPGRPVKENPRNRNSTGVLILTADPGVTLPPRELIVEAEGTLPDGTWFKRRAAGPGVSVSVAGATQQGSVDRQRSLAAPWLGLDLPVAGTAPLPGSLQVALIERKRMEEGDQLKFRWQWTLRDKSIKPPDKVGAQMVGADDTRLIDAQVDPDEPTAGTFLMTTTKLTRPATYDLYIVGELETGSREVNVVSRPIAIEVLEVKSADETTTASSR
jgi:hypothetical protein